ncbi:MAG: helix-turn-helix transcriptional regulator [Agathobacter sp.]|nr:helix-turn-helix transcriptional regulator [Agathobacter sp.]
MEYTQRIRNLREDNDYNQTFVAKAIHVAQTTYSDYEKGKVRMPIESAIALAKFYNVDLNFLMGISDIRNEFPKK